VKGRTETCCHHNLLQPEALANTSQHTSMPAGLEKRWGLPRQLPQELQRIEGKSLKNIVEAKLDKRQPASMQ
jgi:hypothetical protein